MTVGPFKNNKCLCCNPEPVTAQGLGSISSMQASAASQPAKADSGFGVKAMFKFVPQFFHSTEVTGHYINDYVLCKKWRTDLRNKLGVGLSGHCTCAEPPVESDGTSI